MYPMAYRYLLPLKKYIQEQHYMNMSCFDKVKHDVTLPFLGMTNPTTYSAYKVRVIVIIIITSDFLAYTYV